jgi:thiamine biosynthesis lipoprotein
MPSTRLKQTQRHSWAFDAIGTRWKIVSTSEINSPTQTRIKELIEAFDGIYSRFRSDSLIRVMANSPGEYQFPDSVTALFDFYDELWEITDHKVSPMVGSTLASAGYDEAYSLKPVGVRYKVPNYKQALHRTGTLLRLEGSTHIDIGAIGKGFLIDEITELLRIEGHTSFVVDGSGDVRVVGARTETIGLENPRDTSEVVGTVPLSNRALCASATNRRAWGDWHHVIDATTARPTQEIIATWVVADTAMIADGLATALFFVCPQVLAKRYTYEYMRMHADGGVEYSNYFAKGLF